MAVLLLLFGALFLFLNGNFDAILGVNSSRSFRNQLFNTFQEIPIPTPELPISCTVGKFSLNLTETRCNQLQNYVEDQRQIDSSTVQLLINDLDVRIQKLTTPSNDTSQVDVKGILEKPLEACKGNESQVYRCKLNILQIYLKVYGEERQRNHDILMQLYERLNKYKNYLTKIQFGGIGSGACSDHGGVDCSTSRGNIGQAICSDGWDESQVYYFNVKECVEYTESTLN